jgi:LmbE family N-acetylglucosaminyl deacetylase
VVDLFIIHRSIRVYLERGLFKVENTELEKIAMVIVAHPDDAEFGCAGTIAAWIKDGWEVHYLICSDGSGGGSDDAREVGLEARQQITATRKLEQRAACDVLGVKELIFLDFPDGQLEPNISMRKELVRHLRRLRPTRVILQSPERAWQPIMPIPRYHPDHLAAGQAALAAIYPACQNPWDFPELLEAGLEPHRVREIYIMGAPHQNHAVDVSETIGIKFEALKAHTSQHVNFSETEKRVRSWLTAAGQAFGMEFAEVYHLTKN